MVQYTIRPQLSEPQPAQMQGHARHARCGEDARPGGCGGSRPRASPLLTRVHLFPLRLSAAAHIVVRLYPRSRGELERQPFLFALWVLPDPTVVYHRRLHHTKVDVFKQTARTPLLERFWFAKSLEYWLRLFLVYCNTKDNPLQTSGFPIKLSFKSFQSLEDFFPLALLTTTIVFRTHSLRKI